MKIIELDSITNLEPLQGTNEWYYSTDYIHGDLYEAEELYRDGHKIQCNRLWLVHYPAGTVYQPVPAVDGQYFGYPVYDAGSVVLLVVDFPKKELRLLRFSPREEVREIVCLPLSSVVNCYNLMLKTSPLTLTRQPGDGTVEIIWPEQVRFSVGFHESLNFRDGEKLYFTKWQDDERCWEKTVVRAVKDGSVLERFPGDIRIMPDGERWLLR